MVGLMDREGEIICKTLIPMIFYLAMAGILGFILVNIGFEIRI